jgi:hypothetical protein
MLQLDTARQGNDYEYFLEAIYRQPNRKKRYFDIEAKDISDVFDLYEEVGSGGYSVVRRAMHKETREERAVKIIPIAVYAQHRTRMEAEVCKCFL